MTANDTAVHHISNEVDFGNLSNSTGYNNERKP